MSLFGSYKEKLSKGAINLSDKHCKDIGSTCIVTRGIESCLYLFSTESWEEFVQQLTKLPGTKDGRNIRRYFMSNAYEAEIAEHRVMIPEPLRSLLKNDVLIIGMNDRLEIWNECNYEEPELGDSCTL